MSEAEEAGLTFSERVLSAKSGTDARAGDIVVCEPDLILGTDGSTPMAIDYFEAMGSGPVVRPERVLLARDHYAPPTSDSTRGFHARMEAFAQSHGVELGAVGEGISFLMALESDRVHPGDLVVGGDSHTVTCGVAGAFATGVGSSDLAAAFKTGRVWLRVPETIVVELAGALPAGVTGKDLALELVGGLTAHIRAFTALEFTGEGAAALPTSARIVLANMSVEMGAMAGAFPAVGEEAGTTVSNATAPGVAGVYHIELSALEPVVALPHDPGRRVPLRETLGQPVDWVFLGTCAGGQADDFREALRVLTAGGGIAPGVTVVAGPPTAAVREALEADGTLAALEAAGVAIAETGCGPCCGTSGPLPPEGARVISTANRNFRARMGHPSIEITLAAPATCAAAATAGRIVDPRELR